MAIITMLLMPIYPYWLLHRRIGCKCMDTLSDLARFLQPRKLNILTYCHWKSVWFCAVFISSLKCLKRSVEWRMSWERGAKGVRDVKLSNKNFDEESMKKKMAQNFNTGINRNNRYTFKVWLYVNWDAICRTHFLAILMDDRMNAR